ncbi:osmotic avoidance abnormal protein 3 isoform X1 [Schistocerca gregaria]|uniref:osmotic avoidance abnormal protein 3 isoform X1 n=1 Tax=Schistocerca gregaria TaxID=7010 RepID=UPI00211DC203|nr:osmotic avoidance abnormal protein 3 isoform X1 [Schistocerca gregaria]
MVSAMAECVRVVVRCRPMNRRELDLRCKNVVSMDNSQAECKLINPDDNLAPPKRFTFDGVYDVNSTTEELYNEAVYPLVEGVLEGYNTTIFAYGQTGCGKSFTMQGICEPQSQRGIIPKSFEHLFEAISVSEGTKYLVLASFLEIYNEEIRDLLGNEVKRKLELKEHSDKGLYVQDLSLHPVQSVSESEQLMARGWKNRATGATLMNADSSRSHSIFSIQLEMMPVSALECDIPVNKVRKGKLNLVDLAGSERQSKTGAAGDRLKEAIKINLSLTALGHVISALVDGKSTHIPYRDSKLTRLLQDSLGGNTKTLMVGCISPADNNYDETLSTLRYVNRAKNIKNKPRINEDPKDTLLREYQDEIRKLKQMLESTSVSDKGSLVEQEREKLRLEYEKQMEEMRREYEAEHVNNCKLQADMHALKKHYEQQLDKINRQEKYDAAFPSNGVSDESGKLEASIGTKMKLNAAHQEVLQRLERLQKSMIGGECANDEELKEKRLRKKRASERRLRALAQVLSKVSDDDGLMLKVYDDIDQELRTKTELLKKYKMKIRELECENSDLQGEFQKERTDYLETIRKLSRELKLYQQITEKIVPTLRKECNYSDLEAIKKEASWNEDTEQWKLPDLVITRTRLPPTGLQPNGISLRTSSAAWSPSGSSRGSSTANESSHSTSPPILTRSPEFVEPDNKVVLQRFHRSDEQSIVTDYFKPKRAAERLNRVKEEASHAFNTWRGYKNKRKANQASEVNGISNLNLSKSCLHSSVGDLSFLSPVKGNTSLNNSWSGGITTSEVGHTRDIKK